MYGSLWRRAGAAACSTAVSRPGSSVISRRWRRSCGGCPRRQLHDGRLAAQEQGRGGGVRVYGGRSVAAAGLPELCREGAQDGHWVRRCCCPRRAVHSKSRVSHSACQLEQVPKVSACRARLQSYIERIPLGSWGAGLGRRRSGTACHDRFCRRNALHQQMTELTLATAQSRSPLT